MIPTYVAMALWALITASLLCLVVLAWFFFRIITVLVSVTQELRWTAEAYSGRDYKKESGVSKTPDDGKRVQIEPPWNDEMEAKS